MKKLAAILLAALFLAGRWDYQEIKNSTIVTGISADKTTDGEWEIGFELLKIPANRETPIQVTQLSTTGATLQEAERNFAGDVSYNLYVGHSWLLVVSEEVARDGIGDIVTLIAADPKYYMATYIAVVRDARAEKAFASNRVSTQELSYELNNGFETDKQNASRTSPMYAYEILTLLHNANVGYLIPALSIVEKDGQTLTANNGSAVFVQDKIVGFLSAEETEYCNLAVGKVRTASLEVMMGTVPTSMEISKAGSRMGVEWQGDAPIFSLTVNMKVSTTMLARADYETLRNACTATVQKNLKMLFEKAKAMQCDFLGFSTYLRRFHLSQWNRIKGDWMDLFGRSECLVDVRVEVID